MHLLLSERERSPARPEASGNLSLNCTDRRIAWPFQPIGQRIRGFTSAFRIVIGAFIWIYISPRSPNRLRNRFLRNAKTRNWSGPWNRTDICYGRRSLCTPLIRVKFFSYRIAASCLTTLLVFLSKIECILYSYHWCNTLQGMHWENLTESAECRVHRDQFSSSMFLWFLVLINSRC